MFELNQVTKAYGSSLALDRIDLTIQSGQSTVLLGTSGCGKSTLLRTLIGLIVPDAGQVFLQGQPLDRRRILAQRQRMGYVIQSGGLFPHLTARDNATLMARFLKWAQPRIDARLDELMQLTHLPREALERYPTELSGGQNQRVALMRALMLDPEVLLLDEPLGALDPMIRFELQEDLKRIFTTLNKTVVLVTHDLAEAAFLGDAIVLMNQGRILQRGRLEEMIRAPADPFVERFVRAQRSHLDASGIQP